MAELKQIIAEKEAIQLQQEYALNATKTELTSLRAKTELSQSKLFSLLGNIKGNDTLVQPSFNISITTNEQYELISADGLISLVYGDVLRVTTPYYLSGSQRVIIDSYLRDVLTYDLIKFIISEQ